MTQPAACAAADRPDRESQPPIAGLLSGDRAAYRYLPNSLTGFPDADALSQLLRAAGFREVRYRRLGGGAVALHVAEKQLSAGRWCAGMGGGISNPATGGFGGRLAWSH